MCFLIVIIRLIRCFNFATIQDLGEIGRRTASYLEYKVDWDQYDMPYGAPTPTPRECADIQAALVHLWKLKAGGNPSLPLGLRSHDANLDRVSIALNASGLSLSLAVRTEERNHQAAQHECTDLLLKLSWSIWQAYHSLGLIMEQSYPDEFVYIEFDAFGNAGDRGSKRLF